MLNSKRIIEDTKTFQTRCNTSHRHHHHYYRCSFSRFESFSKTRNNDRQTDGECMKQFNEPGNKSLNVLQLGDLTETSSLAWVNARSRCKLSCVFGLQQIWQEIASRRFPLMIAACDGSTSFALARVRKLYRVQFKNHAFSLNFAGAAGLSTCA